MKKWIRVLVFSLAFVGAGLVPMADADAALTAYLKIKGQKSGDIKGSTTRKGQEGAIKIDAISHEIVSPRDAASGLPTGKRQHKPFVITKEIDKSSPLLNSMLVNNENIPKWELGVWAPSPKGTEVLAYTIKLTNANIASIQLVTHDDGSVTEVVSFTYQKIEWTWNDGGITAMDDWESPVMGKSKGK